MPPRPYIAAKRVSRHSWWLGATRDGFTDLAKAKVTPMDLPEPKFHREGMPAVEATKALRDRVREYRQERDEI